MFTQDDDTRLKNEQNVQSEQNDDTQTVNNEETTAEEQQSEKQTQGKAQGLKQAATFVAGAAVGAAASVAADAIAGTQNEAVIEPEPEPEELTNEEAEAETEPAVDETPAAAPAQPQPQPVAPKSEPEIHHTAQQTHQQQTQAETGRGEDQFFKENDVQIHEINTHQMDDGSVVHAATGTVDGHAAMFMDDGHGTVTSYVVDSNDNGDIDEGEFVRVETGDLTMGDLAEHMVEVEVEPEPTATPTADVRVIVVENDVEMGDAVVNVATVNIGGAEGLLIDANQDGEVNIMAIDINQDGDLSDDELQNVTDSHIPMPTMEDTQEYIVQSDDLPDYSNDNDITVYDV